jgi:hypothetical protein
MSSAGVPCATISPPWIPGARPHVDDVVGGEDGLPIVLDDDDRVAEIAQAACASMRRALSRAWRPTLGSSST